jgi:hypothetical protein
MANSPEPEIRHAAAELCGWQSAGFLQDRLRELLCDPYERVQLTAAEAIYRQQKEEWIAALLAAAPMMVGPRSWALFNAVTKLGEPHLLARRDDRLWIGPALEGRPGAFVGQIEADIRARAEEDRRRADDLDRTRERVLG